MNEITTTAQQGIASDDLAKRIINRLFDQLSALYPASAYGWRDISVLDATKAAWISAMMQSGVSSGQDIKRGLDACKREIEQGREYLPSPIVFAKFCKELQPYELGLPDIDSAFIEATKKHSAPAFVEWSHLAVFWAARGISPFDYAHQREAWLKSEFKRLYLLQVEKVARGESLPVAALPSREKPKATGAPAGFFANLFAEAGLV